MEGTKLNSFLVFFFTFVSIVPSLMANIGEFDEVWEKRAEVARQNALESYVAVPENVTSYLNQQVRRTLEEELGVNSKNSSRRQLGKKYLGPCRVTNPIDRCWRCQPNWAANRKRLADCGLGFGYNATGGKYGKYYFVTDSSDENMINPKPGTLRHAVIQNGPLWILFARDMNIRLSEELIMQGDKTIDARGVNVHIAYGAGITIQFVKNVIIHGLHIHDIYSGNGGLIRDSVDHYGLRTRSDGDGISIFGASNIWIDHVSMWKCTDGIIDVVEGSTAITISNSHFTDHNEVMLFGASDAHSQDQIMQITVAFNHFGKRLIQRMPRCRWGYIHVVNNDYTHWEMYAIGGSQHPTIVSQGNRFIAPDDITKKEVTKRDYADEETWKHWTWSSESDVLMNGAFFVESGNPHGSKLIANQYDKMTAAPGGYAATMTRFAGALSCRIGRPC